MTKCRLAYNSHLLHAEKVSAERKPDKGIPFRDTDKTSREERKRERFFSGSYLSVHFITSAMYGMDVAFGRRQRRSGHFGSSRRGSEDDQSIQTAVLRECHALRRSYYYFVARRASYDYDNGYALAATTLLLINRLN